MQLIEVAVCREARIEFGEAVAKKLKLSADGTKVLWPQPTDDPEDPQNVSVHSYDNTRRTLDTFGSGRISARISSFSLLLLRLSFLTSTPVLEFPTSSL